MNKEFGLKVKTVVDEFTFTWKKKKKRQKKNKKKDKKKRKIQSKYIKSEIKNANGTLSVFKNHIKNELKDIYNEQGSYAMIGGNFV